MHFEQIGIEVGVPGQDKPGKRTRKGTERLVPEKVTHYDMEQWLEKAGIDEETKQELLQEIRRYPANTMGHFYANIHKHIERLHKKRKKKEEG